LKSRFFPILSLLAFFTAFGFIGFSHADWGPPAEDAIQFYLRIAQKGRAPYSNINNHRALRYWSSLTYNWGNPLVRQFLESNLEVLTKINECGYCDLTLAAYLGGDLKIREKSILLEKKIYENIKGTEDEKRNFFRERIQNYLYQLVQQQQDSMLPYQLPYEVIGDYWRDLHFPFEWYVEALDSNLNSYQSSKQIELAVNGIFLSLLGGNEAYKQWWKSERRRRVSETLSALDSFVRDSPVANSQEEADIKLNDLRNKWNQTRFLMFKIVAELPAELLYSGYVKMSLTRELHEQISTDILYFLSATKDQSILLQTKKLISHRIAGSDSVYEKKIQEINDSGNLHYGRREWMYDMFDDHGLGSVNRYRYPINDFYRRLQERSTDLRTPAGRKNAYVDQMIDIFLRFHFGGNLESNRLETLAELLGVSFEDLEIFVEFSLLNPKGRLQGFAGPLLQYYKKNRFLEDRLGQLESQRKEKAKEFLGGIPTDLMHEKFQPIQSYLYNVYLHFKDPEIQSAFKNKWEALRTKEMFRQFWKWYTLMIAGSQDSELKRMLLKEIESELVETEGSQWGGSETLPKDKASRLTEEMDGFLNYEYGLVENAESVNEVDKIAHLLSQLSVMKRKEVQDELVMRANQQSSSQGRMTKISFLRRILKYLMTEDEYKSHFSNDNQSDEDIRRVNWYQEIIGNIGFIETLFQERSDSNGNPNQFENLPEQFQNIEAEVFAEPVQKLVLEKMERWTLSKEEVLSGYIWYLTLRSDKEELVNSATKLFRLRTLGDDLEFNRIWGREGDSSAKRFEILFNQLMSSRFGKKWNLADEDFFVNFVTSLRLEYEIIGPHLEHGFSSSLDPLLRNISGRIIREAKGPIYLESLPDLRDRKKFLYVNGGYIELANNSTNEEDLKSFHYNLFYGKATILNAGGPGGTVVAISNGQQDRDETGLIKFSPGLELEKPFLAATTENLKITLGDIHRSNPLWFTAVFGDHGGPQSLSLWNGDYLTAPALQKMYREFSDHTLIRSIFLQCYAGTLIVSNERKPPPFILGLPKFLEYHYAENRCAYANSHHDELGAYYSEGSKWDVSSWSKLFKLKPQLTLKALKEFILTESRVQSTPILSSDYLIYDVVQTFCQEAELFSKLSRDYGSDSSSWPDEGKRQLRFLTFHKLDPTIRISAREGLCQSKLEVERRQIVVEYEKMFNLIYQDLMILDNQWRREIIKEKYENIYNQMIEGNRQRTEIIAKYANDGNDFEVMNEEDRQKVRDIQNRYHFPYQHLLLSLDHKKEFDLVLNQKAIDHFAANRGKYSPFISDDFLKVDHWRRVIDEVMSNARGAMRSKQISRKDIERRIYRERVENLRVLFPYPEFRFVKERFERLLDCENSVLN
jgi:hypothetical protein